MTETKNTKKLYRSGANQMIGGVCAGMSEYLNIDVTIVRIIWLLSVLVNGIGLIAYLVCLVFVPLNPEHASLPPSERKKAGNAGLFIGIALVFIGFLFIFHNLVGHIWMFNWHWYGFWPFQWHLVWPLLIIGFGVWYIISTMQKDKAIKEKDKSPSETKSAIPKYVRSKTTRMIAGVCGGLANYWNVDVTLVRIGFIIVTLATHFILGVGVYIALIILAPEDELKPVTSKPIKSQPPKKAVPVKTKKAEPGKTKKTEGKNE